MESAQSISSLIDKGDNLQDDKLDNSLDNSQINDEIRESNSSLDMHVVPDHTLDGAADKTPQLSYKPHEDSFHSSEENQPVVEEQTVEYSKRTSSKEQSTRPTSLLINDLEATAARGSTEPHALVIASLRAQIDELNSQLNSLNTKLVRNFEKSDNLEYEMDSTKQEMSRLHNYIKQLEKEKASIKESLDNGTLVERENVMQELTRMVDSIVTETQKATTARQDKAAIEQDLDDLSANLFGEANRMVGVERLIKAQEIERRKVAEERLAEAEEAVRLTQKQMNEWVERAERAERAERTTNNDPLISEATATTIVTTKIIDNNIPFLEFLSYLTTLANLIPVRQSQSKDTPLPALDLGHAFLRRVLEEDIEPTLRLDLSRAFGLLTRGKVLSAIVEGSLELEPAAKNEFGPGTECALSGRLLIPESTSNGMNKTNSQSSLFGFRSNRSITSIPTPPITVSCENIFVFRLSNAPNATRYPVDPVWALPRLRATCEFWRYIRTLQQSIITLSGAFKPPNDCQTLKNVGENVVNTTTGEEKRTTRTFWGSFGRSSSQPASPSPLANPPVSLPELDKEKKNENVEVDKDEKNADDNPEDNSKKEQITVAKDAPNESNESNEGISQNEANGDVDKKEETNSEVTNNEVKDTPNETIMSSPQPPPAKPKRGKKGRGRKGTVTGAPPVIPAEKPSEEPSISENPTEENKANEDNKEPEKENPESKETESKGDDKAVTNDENENKNALDLKLNTPAETWEMTRWRQILELKHNMFWARVNGDPSAI
ncbi:hypothetical protein E3Q22_03220 [Wallemia mellicola]|uniref:GDP/GTP exchange factor Sec2 N-terminal domain-containing protein n=1 Tax=Wallemia mellicola TaxID=1708541 RepID=A0A4T0M356_9BASI|nr:hypothetical protein E3Q22_03220 [Wallemia mellicola]TIC10836.1 hypothetical protein E3Q14_02604 [Wallemia mellicola]TIC52251.1 hypothetical protein E3Q05_02820 [Wallemia mellicola]